MEGRRQNNTSLNGRNMNQIDKYQRAWTNFQRKMAVLKDQKTGLVKKISKKLDQQELEKLRKQIK